MEESEKKYQEYKNELEQAEEEDKQEGVTPAKPPKASTGQATGKKKPAR